MFNFLSLVFVLSGVLIGFLIGYLVVHMLVSKKNRLEQDKYNILDKAYSTYKAENENDKLHLAKQIENLQKDLEAATEQMSAKDKIHLEQIGAKDKLNTEQKVQIAEKEAEIKSMEEKLTTLKKEVEQIGEKYAAEFKNLANEILEDKSQRFTQKNRENLEAILKPLDENIKEFKQTVTDVYVKEAQERFSLGEKVKELADLNSKISEEAHNLTMALKGDFKKQGDWGEMILESILEKSGLRKGEQYFTQEELRDDEGKALRSSLDGKKMRPDVIVRYPDQRSVIIDSKVSLNAFTQYIDAETPEQQQKALNQHISDIKTHIISLSNKAYDDYDKSLDFVMMFIPSEPAYIAAMQGDKDLWSFAYDKRILLMSPLNLITSLKLVLDLWKRDDQNKNAMAIAERGTLLYDKFVGFVESLQDVGDKIKRASEAYQNAQKRLNTGDGNLLRQVEMLKDLGVKSKKDLSPYLPKDEIVASLEQQLEKEE